MADTASDTPDLPTFDPAVLGTVLKKANTDAELFRAIVNTPFQYPVETAMMFLGIVSLVQVNKRTGQLDRVALADTEQSKSITDVANVQFSDLKVPLSDKRNIIAKAIRSGEPQGTTDWNDLLIPALPPEQARINQATGGIAYSAVYPLQARDGGALIFYYFQYEEAIGDPQREFMEMYTRLVDECLAQRI